MRQMREKKIASFLELIRQFSQIEQGKPVFSEKLKSIMVLANEVGQPSQGGVTSSQPLPAQKYFNLAIENAKKRGSLVRELAKHLEDLNSELSWYLSPISDAESFKFGHANTQVIGPIGRELHSKLVIGLSLLSPGVEYPDHSHAPEEVYIPLSLGEWRHNSKDWVKAGYGELIATPSNLTHSMRAQNEPLLTIWCLDGSNF